MTATLRPIRDDEYGAWRSRSTFEYARSMIDHGGLPEDGGPVGTLWVCERDNDMGSTMFVYELFVEADARGRGIGRAAMTLAEDEARRRGLDSITLNVFGGNEPARGLYKGLGYRETAVFMTKDL